MVERRATFARVAEKPSELSSPTMDSFNLAHHLPTETVERIAGFLSTKEMRSLRLTSKYWENKTFNVFADRCFKQLHLQVGADKIAALDQILQQGVQFAARVKHCKLEFQHHDPRWCSLSSDAARVGCDRRMIVERVGTYDLLAKMPNLESLELYV